MEPLTLVFVIVVMLALMNLPEAREQEVMRCCPACGADPNKGDKHHPDCQWR